MVIVQNLFHRGVQRIKRIAEEPLRLSKYATRNKKALCGSLWAKNVTHEPASMSEADLVNIRPHLSCYINFLPYRIISNAIHLE